METRAHYALIGAFTLAVLVAAFGFVFWFSGKDQGAGRKTYRLVFTSSVSGLSRGATVLFNGLRVGEVTKIDLADDPRIVYAMIELDQRTPIKADTKARLEYQGLTGVASVALTGGSASAEPVEKGEDGSPPTIYAERSEFQNIVETLQNLSGKVDNILERADKLISENGPSIASTVRNVEKFSAGLADSSGDIKSLVAGLNEIANGVKPLVETIDRNTGNIDGILKDSRELVAKLSSSADKLDSLMKSAQNIVGGDGARGVIDDVSDAAKSISTTAKAFRKLSENLDSRTRDITAGISRATGPTLRQLDTLASDARRALDEVNRTVRSLEKNPQQLIFGAKPQVPEYSAR